ncbi:DUF4258 domain-containing protein [Cellulosimicrobium cellulans]|uniref:DUF4258 domain-containing protein n=1 Tax=Cellulosimicrobium cellulans TaxID=1710 RepID=UPI0036E61377
MSASLWITLAVVAIVIALAARKLTRQDETAVQPTTPVRITQHAQQRMALRGVTTAQIEATVARPDRFRRDHVMNSVRLEADHQDRVLKVWVTEPWPAAAEVVVKSAAWHYRTTLTVPPDAVGRLIGRGGRRIESVRAETGAHIRIDRDIVTISADSASTIDHAQQRIASIVTSP